MSDRERPLTPMDRIQRVAVHALAEFGTKSPTIECSIEFFEAFVADLSLLRKYDVLYNPRAGVVVLTLYGQATLRPSRHMTGDNLKAVE